MKFDVKSSMEGLWLAPIRYGYLGDWFMRLRHPLGQFVPLKPGLNVIYGRNGAGKTQLLRAIEHASRYKMSAYEGFVLRNPLVRDLSGERLLFDKSAEEILEYFRQSEVDETNFTQSSGLSIQLSTTPEIKLVVKAIIGEFMNQKRCMLARSMADTWDDGARGQAIEMNDPQSIQLVPILLPQDEAPVTRAHAKEIADSYLDLVEKIRADMDAVDDDDDDGRSQIAYEAIDRFDEWARDWMWSPLMNQRNFGFIEDSEWAWAAESHAHALVNCQTSALFLPSIWSQSTSPEYTEFGGQFATKSDFHFTLMLEGERSSAEEPRYLMLEDEELGIPKYRLRGKEDEIAAERPILIAKYLSGLREKLGFLPGLRHLHFQTDEADPSIGRIEARHYFRLSGGVDASQGSDAERRWLALAREAQARTTEWVIVDEPEAGLHRTAEAELARALASPAWNSGSVVVVATHSPEFLDLPNAHVLHIDAGIVREFTSADRKELALLGLRPADLLTQIRSFLLVEGEHEKLIFEALFAEELRRLRCKIIVARGGKNMKDVFESQMIFEFSDAPVISLLDNIDAQTVTNLWKEAREMAGKGEVIEAGKYVRSRLPGAKSGENVFLSQFLTLALANGQHERVEVWGLSKADIVLYLPPSELGLKKSWDALLEERKPTDPSIKEWARSKYRADFSEAAISRAAQSLDHIPDDFGNLLMQISSLSRANSVSSNE